jgi:membrane fusion protein, multidrug efflux system
MWNKKWMHSTFLCSTLALGIFALGACSKTTPDADSQSEIQQILIPVKTAYAQVQDLTQSLQFSGTVDAIRRAGLAPAIPGSRVMHIHVQEGQRVTQGQLLVTMEDFQLQQTAAQLRQLEADYNRMATLHKRGSVTAQQYDQIKAAFDAASAGYQLQKKSVELRAPFNGRIIGPHINEGEIFNGMGTDGTPAVISIGQLEKVKVEIMVPEREFSQLRAGQKAYIKADAFPDTLFTGAVTTVNPALHRVTRSARVTIEANNPSMLLKPGMFARVSITAQEFPNVLAVPASAVVMREDAPHVFTVPIQDAPHQSTPVLQPVTTGIIVGGFTQILSGLAAGTKVITDNNTSLTPRTPVWVLTNGKGE